MASQMRWVLMLVNVASDSSRMERRVAAGVAVRRVMGRTSGL
jgi:hypothetical protein